MARTGRQRTRELNILAAMRALISLGTASRSELAAHVGLDRSTMTHITSTLLAAGLIEPVAEAPAGSRGGRRAELLSVDRSRYAILSADLQSRNPRWLLTNLRGERLQDGQLGPSMPAAGGAVRRAWVEGILDDLRHMVRSQPAGRQVPGVGIALPGLFDRSRTRLVESFELGLRDVDLQALWNCSSPPLFAANDATCYAWREIAARRDELSRGEPTAADGVYVYTKFHTDGERFLATGMGVGVTIVADGHIVRGHRGAAGELRGYRHSNDDEDQLGIDLEAIRRGEGQEAAITTAASELIRNLGVIASVLDPPRIVVCGDLGLSAERFRAIAAEITHAGRPEIEYRTAEPLAVARGAAQMVLEGLFSPDAQVDQPLLRPDTAPAMVPGSSNRESGFSRGIAPENALQ